MKTLFRELPQSFALLLLDFIATLFVVGMTVGCTVVLVAAEASILGKLLMGLLWACPIAAAWLFHLILQDARYRDPFTRRNVSRLNWMGGLILLPWLLTSGWVGKLTQWAGDRQEFNLPNPAALSVSGLTLALVLFGLASVFQRGVKLREEQELTI